MSTSINHIGSVVLPTTLVPTLLADAASLLSDSTTSTVQHAMASYQQAMLLLVRWYEAGQLEGREPRPLPPTGGGLPRAIEAGRDTVPCTAAEAVSSSARTTAPSRNVAPPTTTSPAPIEVAIAETAPAPVVDAASEGHETAAPLTAQALNVPPQAPAPAPPVGSAMAPTPAPTAGSGKARPFLRPLLPPSAPPLEGPPPSDALGQAARVAISRRYDADAADPDA